MGSSNRSLPNFPDVTTFSCYVFRFPLLSREGGASKWDVTETIGQQLTKRQSFEHVEWEGSEDLLIREEAERRRCIGFRTG
eukprot:4574485-Amphidinium_carterae.1